jgi:hypothetical protein
MGRTGQFDPSFDIPFIKRLINVSNGLLCKDVIREHRLSIF